MLGEDEARERRVQQIARRDPSLHSLPERVRQDSRGVDTTRILNQCTGTLF